MRLLLTCMHYACKNVVAYRRPSVTSAKVPEGQRGCRAVSVAVGRYGLTSVREASRVEDIREGLRNTGKGPEVCMFPMENYARSSR